MKNFYTFILIVVCFFAKSQSSGWYSQYFDVPNSSTVNPIIVSIGTNTDNVWQIGKPQKTLFTSASTTPNVIVTDTINPYPESNISSFTFYWPGPAWGPGYLAIQWKQKLDMEKNNDGGIVEFSINSGNTWQNAMTSPNVYQYYGFTMNNIDTINGEVCFSGTDNVWRDIWFCLNSNIVSQNDTIYMRFTFKSNANAPGKDGWMIDNLLAHPTIFHPIKEISQAENVVIYPNVTTGVVNIEMKKSNLNRGIDNLELLDAQGKLLESYGSTRSKVIIDLTKFPTGYYFVKVTIDKKTTTHRILYEKT